MKRSMGRLGAVVGAVALLAGGLVGVAAPAHADRPFGFWENFPAADKEVVS